MTIQIDREFRALIPPLTPDERQQLEANLKADGCRDPLVVWNGLLLDGHHRFEICTNEHLPYRTVEQPCATRDDAKVWIIQHQFGRRNLNMAQRAELALRLEPLIAAQAKAREWSGRTLGSNEPRGKTATELAAIAGLSSPTMIRARAVYLRGTPELKEEMRSGKVKVSAAYDRLKAGEALLPPPGPPRKPHAHKRTPTPTVRKESDLPATLAQLLMEFRQKRKANNDDMSTRKWIPHGISVVRQKQIMDWMEEALDQLVRQLQALMPSASGAPATKSRRSTSIGEDDHGNQETSRTTH